MASNVVDKFLISIGFDVKEMKQSANDIDRTIKDLSKSISNTFESAFAGIASYFSLDFGKNIIESFAKVGTSLNNISKDTGINVSKINAYEEAIKRLGGSSEDLDNTLTTLQKNLNSARISGNSPLTQFLTFLGVNPKDNKGNIKSSLQILQETGNVLRTRYKDQQTRYGIAQQYGISNRVTDLFTMDPKQQAQLLQHIQSIGVMNEGMTKNAMMLKQNLDDLSQSWTNFKNVIGQDLTPDAIAISNFIQQLLQLSVKLHPITAELVKIGSIVSSIGLAKYGISKIIPAIGKMSLVKTSLIGTALLGQSNQQDTLPENELGDYYKKSGKYKNLKTTASSPITGLTAEEKAIEYLESKGDPNTKTQDKYGKWALGLFQIKPTFFAKTIQKYKDNLSKLHLGEMTNNLITSLSQMNQKDLSSWLMDPQNNTKAMRMMLTDFNTGKHNNAAKIKMYSGGNYDYARIQDTINKLHLKDDVYTPNAVMNTNNTMPANAAKTVTNNIQNVNLPNAKNPEDWHNYFQKNDTHASITYASGRSA